MAYIRYKGKYSALLCTYLNNKKYRKYFDIRADEVLCIEIDDRHYYSSNMTRMYKDSLLNFKQIVKLFLFILNHF